jgi:hypothetical protein
MQSMHGCAASIQRHATLILSMIHDQLLHVGTARNDGGDAKTVDALLSILLPYNNE